MYTFNHISSPMQIQFFSLRIESNIGPLFEILNWITQFLSFLKVTIRKYLLSSFNIKQFLWHPVCGLCCRQAAVFFQYLVGHSAPMTALKKSQESRPLLTTALHTATFFYWDTVPSLYILHFNKSTLYFTTIVTRFFDEIEIFISLDASFWALHDDANITWIC